MHKHEFAKLVAIEVNPKSSKEKMEIDQMRANHPDRINTPPFDQAYGPYDYKQNDRVILAGECECGQQQAIDMLPRDEARELYKEIKERRVI